MERERELVGEQVLRQGCLRVAGVDREGAQELVRDGVQQAEQLLGGCRAVGEDRGLAVAGVQGPGEPALQVAGIGNQGGGGEAVGVQPAQDPVQIQPEEQGLGGRRVRVQQRGDRPERETRPR